MRVKECYAPTPAACRHDRASTVFPPRSSAVHEFAYAFFRHQMLRAVRYAAREKDDKSPFRLVFFSPLFSHTVSAAFIYGRLLCRHVAVMLKARCVMLRTRDTRALLLPLFLLEALAASVMPRCAPVRYFCASRRCRCHAAAAVATLEYHSLKQCASSSILRYVVMLLFFRFTCRRVQC